MRAGIQEASSDVEPMEFPDKSRLAIELAASRSPDIAMVLISSLFVLRVGAMTESALRQCDPCACVGLPGQL